MSLAGPAGTTVVALVTLAAAVSAWRGASRHAAPVKHAYWLLGLSGVLFGMGAAAHQALAAAGAGPAFPLGLSDLPGLLGLATLVAGVAWLRPRPQSGWHPLAQRRPGRLGTGLAHLADGYVLASALFIVCWLTTLGPAYAHAGDGPGTFAGQLTHPLADLLLLGALLPLAADAGPRGRMPFLALLLLSVGDALSVGARIDGTAPGIAALILVIAGLGLLAAAPWLASAGPAGPADAAELAWNGLHVSTAGAALATAAAAVIAAGYALAGRPVAEPVLAVAAATLLLALTLRIVLLLHRDSVRARLWHEAGQQFRELADRTSDAVLVTDYAGRIGYASPAVRDYGYTADRLAGQPLADLVHPEDRLGGIRAVREAAHAPAQQIRYTCRIRAADGTWRYVEATISRHRSQGAPDRLLVTARDVSEAVALRRQIAHLTHHDGLTGLPNRAYLEERGRELLTLGRPAGGPDGAEAGDPSAPPQPAAESGAAGPQESAPAAGETEPPAPPGGLAGVILLNLDSFTAVNELAGPAAGDLVLAQMARRLRTVVPPRGTVGRWGGDEFAVLLTGAATATEIIDLAQRIRAVVAAEPFRAADRVIGLTASLGVATADGSPAGYVWRNANRGVSAAKQAGGDQVKLYPACPPAGSRPPLRHDLAS
jgi:diguanylate cyclase (GGDEF)-like protein/PAS domain S-box-containing protein